MTERIIKSLSGITEFRIPTTSLHLSNNCAWTFKLGRCLSVNSCSKSVKICAKTLLMVYGSHWYGHNRDFKRLNCSKRHDIHSKVLVFELLLFFLFVCCLFCCRKLSYLVIFYHISPKLRSNEKTQPCCFLLSFSSNACLLVFKIQSWL